MVIEKRENRHTRQTVGLLPYLFPSMAASGFDLEVPLSLEDVRERLDKLAQVRRAVPYDEGLGGNLWGAFAARTPDANHDVSYRSAGDSDG